MLVEINLLPKKEEKNRSLLMLYIIIGIVLGVGLLAVFYFSDGLEKEIASKKQEITATKHILETAQMQLADLNESSTVSELESAVKWADDYPVKTVPLLKMLTSLLPERGFIQQFGYQSPGAITLSVQFDTNREAAYFLNNLNESQWVTETFMQGLTTNELDGTEEADKFSPRYIGEFQIQIDKDKLDEVSSDEQGGNPS